MFSEQETQVLQRYFTSTDKQVFGLRNLPEVVKGTLFSRYSRSAKDLRRLFLDEFYTNPDVAAALDHQNTPLVNTARAEDFYDRILVGYGDDSVAELGGAHVAVEGISMLATKAIEEHRIGLSPLEKSTRYVYYDKRKPDGSWPYVRDMVVVGSEFADEYETVLDGMFDAYSKIVREAQVSLMQIYPGDITEQAYRFSIRAKACDIARNLLPLATETNMGVMGNGRAFEYMITTMLGDRIDEVRLLGLDLSEELGQMIPSFVKRATSPRGDQMREYIQRTHDSLRNAVGERVDFTEKGYRVNLVDFDNLSPERIIASVIYEKSDVSYEKAMQLAQGLSDEQKAEYFASMGIHRKVRQHRPLRYTEESLFGFEIVADWGVYKDLMRHRMMTRHKKLFSAKYGYSVPEELEVLGFKDVYTQAMDRATDLQLRMAEKYPEQAQYVVAHGHYTPFYLSLNLRALSHMVELRSTPQGHPTYRAVAQDMAAAVVRKFPEFGGMLQFVDYNNYELERLNAFRRLEAKGHSFTEES